MYCRCPSASSVSKASELFPDPLSPVITTSRQRSSWSKGAIQGWVPAADNRLLGPRALVPTDLKAWRELRGGLEQRQGVRTLGRRFRIDPAAYLKSLEDSLINQSLPP